jgi:hypothetical protein
VRGRVFVRGTLEVASGGVVEGFIQALDIDVHGRLAGVVRAAVEVRLHPDGQVSGDVEAPRVRFVKAETPAVALPPSAAVTVAPSPVVARTPVPVALPTPSPAREDDERPPLPPAHAGQVSGPLPPWPPQGLPKMPPVWAPRSARPASAPPPPEPEVEDAGPPPPPSITGRQRQIVVKRK